METPTTKKESTLKWWQELSDLQRTNLIFKYFNKIGVFITYAEISAIYQHEK